MKYKLFVTDVDGTLTTDFLEPIPKRTKVALKELSHRMNVSICSGRSLEDVNSLVESLDLNPSYHIAENGAKIINEHGDVIQSYVLSEELLGVLYNETHSLVSGFGLCTNGSWKDGFSVEPNCSTLSIHTRYRDITKQVLRILESLGLPIKFGVGSNHLRSDWELVLVTDKHASKEQGIKYIQDKLRVSKTETIGVGDMPNDLHIFGAVGLKVAVGNADLALKESSNLIIDSVSEQGVALFAESLLEGSFN